MAETYPAGYVTAYGAAVRGGYTGTYEEFCAEQAKFAENAAAVAQAKEDVETMQGQVEQAAVTFTDTTVPAAVTTVQEAGAAQVQAVQSEGTMQAAAVETVGAQQKAAVEAAGSDAVDAVEAAETAATDAVTAAQTAAVQAVQTESSTQQAAVQAKGEQTIASIPADYTALSGEVDDLKSALFAESAVASADLTALSRSINPSSKWTILGGATAGYIAIPSNAEKIVITPKSGVTNAWAFLNSIGTPTTGEKPDFSSSYPARISDNTSTPHTYVVEPDMHFIYFLQTNTNSVDVFPASVSIQTIQLIDDTLSIPGKAADAKTTGDAISAVSAAVPEVVGTFDSNNLAAESLSGHGITPANVWSWGNVQRSFICRIPDTVKFIKVTPIYDGTVIAFLASAPEAHPDVGSSIDLSAEYPSRIMLNVGDEVEYQIRGTMRYFFALTRTSADNAIGPEITFTASSTRLPSVDEELADETAATDRKNEVYAMLTAFGKCELGKGVFYTDANLVVPDGAVLCGSGKGTTVKLLASVESGSAIKMGPYATVRDMAIKGADTDQNGNETEGSRNGIEWTGETQAYGTVDNCRIVNFSGAGIYLHDTTQKTYRGLSIISCNIRGCYVGIDIRKDSEFNKIANCIMTGNNIGYRNRGGNNNITNCGLDANKTGILVDNAAGTNNGHGFISNCSIDHSDSNTGYGLIIKGTGRMVVCNCNMYFSKLRLENTNGNVITGCGFGRSAGWEIEGGECSLINGCMVRGWDSENSPVTITNNTAVKIVNCFDRNGVPYA